MAKKNNVIVKVTLQGLGHVLDNVLVREVPINSGGKPFVHFDMRYGNWSLLYTANPLFDELPERTEVKLERGENEHKFRVDGTDRFVRCSLFTTVRLPAPRQFFHLDCIDQLQGNWRVSCHSRFYANGGNLESIIIERKE